MQKSIIFCFLSLALPVSAIVVQTNSIAETEPDGLNWNYVYNYKGSSAVAVGGDWLLTAGHVADDGGDGSLPNAPGYQQQEIIYHPNADLALVRYDKAFPGYYSLYTSENPTVDLPGLDVKMVGFGATGTVSTTYYTDSGTGKNTKRWGSQIIDRTSIKRYDSNGTVGYTENSGFLMDFDLIDTTTDHEAGGAVGDSGGGVFYNGKLAGIMTSRSGGPQYIGTFAVAIPAYADWITETIPEPAAMGLIGFGTIGLFLTRAKRRRKLAGRSLLPIMVDEPMCDRFDGLVGGETDRAGSLYSANLSDIVKVFRSSPPAVWINAFYMRCRALNECVLKLLITAFERSAIKKEVARERVMIAVENSIDTFLEQVSWDRVVVRLRSAGTKSNQALKMRIRKSLDAFLDIIPWDQMVAAYRRCMRPFDSDRR